MVLSIIIPFYNASKYLRESLESILMQSEAESCEILLINDGSTDNSLNIALSYKEKYSNIRVIDKENSGVSSSRNRGLLEASGDYILFMDADDCLHPNSLKVILSELTSSKPDVLNWQYKTFYTKARYKAWKLDTQIDRLNFSSQEVFNLLMSEGVGVSIWTKAIRRDLILGKVALDETMTYGEDMFFSWKCILLAYHIVYIHFPLYYYRQTTGSAVGKYHSNLYEKYASAFSDLLTFVEDNQLKIEISSDIDFHFACRLPALASMEIRAPYSYKCKLIHFDKILSDNRINRALINDNRLCSRIYQLAKQKKVSKILRMSRLQMLKTRLLMPLKQLFK